LHLHAFLLTSLIIIKGLYGLLLLFNFYSTPHQVLHSNPLLSTDYLMFCKRHPKINLIKGGQASKLRPYVTGALGRGTSFGMIIRPSFLVLAAWKVGTEALVAGEGAAGHGDLG